MSPQDRIGLFQKRVGDLAQKRLIRSNALFAEAIFRFDAAIGLKNIRSVICLGNTWTARRYPMTLHRHWPEVEKMLVMVDTFKTQRSLWHTDAEFSRRMLGEWDKIEPYKAKGFIAEWPGN